ncbi:MAG: hypothetical protein EHM36_05890 [Deltaproteobacteria bacterium]|nr:MAG: hypothetical protein EHM36_05890 [Deltaproteobacteria bacterium]
MNRKTFPLFFCLILLLLLPSGVYAQVEARIRIIEASNAGPSIDPALRDVHDQLGSLFNFSSYRLLKDIRLNLLGNRPVEVPLYKGRSMQVTLVGEYRNMIELRIRMTREGAPVLNTQVRLTSGRTILIGGPRHEGGVLICALSSKF